ncbi:uncharacterized protein CDAR_365471 [Caerostris darwini]|uniref:Uncharacterized protein n=1 Tax=Caerostris darwini TaxID=1538125 RepID=A0AAV4QCF4_9ARAC|nr:uncharacterized protein CDAR_365471 [Caerostris darwini]
MRSYTKSVLLVCSLVLWSCAQAQDDNWGVKVKCYVVDGTAVCPGCNSRAGLSCPRFDPDMDRVCRESPPALSSSVPPVVTDEDINKPDCDEETTKEPEVITKSSALEPISTPISEISLMKNKTWRESLKNDEDMRIFLYSIIQPLRKTQDKKNKREVPDELEEGTCRWNGDCPCPLICCRAGEGCPRRCKMGIRLPPPWGK